MLKIKIKNQMFVLQFQSSLLNELLILVYDSKNRLLFEIPFCEIPEVESLKEEIRLRLYPKEESQSMSLHKQTFKEDCNLLGDLFNPSLFGFVALKGKI